MRESQLEKHDFNRFCCFWLAILWTFLIFHTTTANGQEMEYASRSLDGSTFQQYPSPNSFQRLNNLPLFTTATSRQHMVKNR